MSSEKPPLNLPLIKGGKEKKISPLQKGKIKALILFSGGLDSILSTETLKRQKIYCEGLFFTSPFWNSEKTKLAAKKLGIKLNILKLDDDYLKIIKKPKFGRGKQMNPCLDCRIFMLKQAKKFIRLKNFDILATGEVLGQRPMTQNKSSLNFIEKKSGLSKKILRPLSSKILPETIFEKRKLIERKKLFDFQGRSRKPQMALAKKWKIKNYSTPSGGCLLTDLEFSKRLKELFEKHPRCKMNEIELLKLGRHFWEEKTKIIVGRNEGENKKLKKLARQNDILIEFKKIPGPLVLIRGSTKRAFSNKMLNINKLRYVQKICGVNKKTLKKAFNLIIRYSRKASKPALLNEVLNPSQRILNDFLITNVNKTTKKGAG